MLNEISIFTESHDTSLSNRERVRGMIASLLKTVLPVGSSAHRKRTASGKYSLYLAQQRAMHHFDSLQLALGVLECDGTPEQQAEWLQLVADAADKCSLAVDECVTAA